MMTNLSTHRLLSYNPAFGLLLFLTGSILVAFLPMPHSLNPAANDWPEYQGGPDRNHFSTLVQIDSTNLNQLEKVWEYASGGADTTKNQTQIQCNSIIINGILYGVSAASQAFAVDAATGRELWKTTFTDETFSMTSRGVTYWTDGSQQRIFFSFGHLLYALDAKTGKPIPAFGQSGKVNLRDGLERPGADEYVVGNTPGVIFENLIIIGVRVSEGPTALSGDIRAYDVRTGRVVWTFHTIPKPGEFGHQTWPAHARQHIGGANSWMGMAIDRKRGIVYAPTGSAAFDFYGGNRHGSNLFANCLLALNARTGKRHWHYQMVHHDIWDRDLPTTPNLFSTRRGNKTIDAVAQITKQGHIFVFDRQTGQPLFPIEERPMKPSDMPGEQTHVTQPIPTLPQPFTRQTFTKEDLNPFVANRDEVYKQVQSSRTGEVYLPINRQRTIIFPGSDGGAQWGGAAVDAHGIMYVPAKEIPVYTSLTDAPPQQKTGATNQSLQPQNAGSLPAGERLYQASCASCHGLDRKGDHSGAYPSLLGLTERMKEADIHQLMAKGRGMMPAFTHLSITERQAIIDFLAGRATTASVTGSGKPARSWVPYVHTGYNRWYDSNGYPINTPPWGTLTAINLHSGQRLWQVPLGEFPALTAKGFPPTGTDNYGGPVVTANGLVFIAATPDQKFRVFDAQTGRLRWEAKLPAAGYATPSMYAVRGRQYIVIACGGGKLRSKSGDRYVAYALKQ